MYDDISKPLNTYNSWTLNPFDLSPDTNLEYEVMLRYAIEKNGGTVIVNQKTIWTPFGSIKYGLKSITTTLNGITNPSFGDSEKIVPKGMVKW
jgi:hypothetical protein